MCGQQALCTSPPVFPEICRCLHHTPDPLHPQLMAPKLASGSASSNERRGSPSAQASDTTSPTVGTPAAGVGRASSAAAAAASAALQTQQPGERQQTRHAFLRRAAPPSRHLATSLLPTTDARHQPNPGGSARAARAQGQPQLAQRDRGEQALAGKHGGAHQSHTPAACPLQVAASRWPQAPGRLAAGRQRTTGRQLCTGCSGWLLGGR